MKELFKKKIMLFLQKSGRKAIKHKELLERCKVKHSELKFWKDALSELIEEGYVFEGRTGYFVSKNLGFFPATVTRVNKTFGFIERNDDKTEVFIPGKYLLGSMPGDTVAAKLIESRSGKPEGEVVRVLRQSLAPFTGVIVNEDGVVKILPDTFVKTPIALINGEEYKVGDKVMAEIVSRGTRHSEHKAKVVSSFGSAQEAWSCAKSVLELNGISLDFPLEVQDEAKALSSKEITEKDISYRTDLRNDVIFTIDGADTKDIDDAISLRKYDSFYELGVHIADVSHYVRPKSALDDEAFERGTSVYYADKVVPMLPKELSNGICSLNPGVDRLAFSCIMTINFDGKLEDFDFKKTVIRSRVKGVYSEINQILQHTESEEIKEKYKECYDSIFLMEELAEILTRNKIKRGAPQIETTESKIIVENNKCVDVKNREQGKSELIIEEFMLMANQSAATLGRMKGLPFVYRIHEDPAVEKVDKLKQTLVKMNIPFPKFTEIKPCHLAKILEEVKDTPQFPVINKLVLRSMAKAKYSTDPVGHFGLVLDDYAHFTSPIRRYPDLSIHRILSDLVAGMPEEKIKKRYKAFAVESSQHSSSTEQTAMIVERDCEDCYKAEYMKEHLNETYEGIISGVTDYGFYVELPNTVEGLVSTDSLPKGVYEFDGIYTMKDALSGKEFSIGNNVKVKCVKADVSSGNIDFVLSDD